MLKRITIGVLAIMMILAVGCGRAGGSLKETDGVALDRVFVEFTVPSGDSRVCDLLDSLGSHIMQTGFYDNRVVVSVPQGTSVTNTVDALEESELVEDAGPYYLYAPDEVTVKFTVAHDDEKVTALLENLGSQITRTYEYSDFVLVSVPEDKTVAEMVETLSGSHLVEYAEPNYCYYIAAPDYTCIW